MGKLSKRFTEHVLNGKGLYARGYWVSARTICRVKQIYTGVFELTKFTQDERDDCLLSYSVVKQEMYIDTQLDLLLEDMRNVAPLSRWWPNTLDDNFGMRQVPPAGWQAFDGG